MKTEFTATSGNHCALKTITIGDRSGTNATWETDPSQRDIEEATVYHTNRLSEHLGTNVLVISIRESDPQKISDILKSHLGGGNG
jgi:hypothetical protein